MKEFGDGAIVCGVDTGSGDMTVIAKLSGGGIDWVIVDEMHAEDRRKLQSCIIDAEFDLKRYEALFNPKMPVSIGYALEPKSRRPFYDNFNAKRKW